MTENFTQKITCPHCNGRGKSLYDPIELGSCSKCGGAKTVMEYDERFEWCTAADHLIGKIVHVSVDSFSKKKDFQYDGRAFIYRWIGDNNFTIYLYNKWCSVDSSDFDF